MMMQDQRSRALWVILLSGLSILAAVIGFDLFQDYAHVNAEERKQLAIQTKVIDKNLMQRLAATNAAIDTLRDDVPVMLRQHDGSTQVNQRLRALVRSMVGIRTFVVIDINGYALASNREELIGREFHDNNRFLDMRGSADMSTLYVPPPFETVLGAYSLGISKVIPDQQGKFGGSIIAILDPDFFKTLMQSVRYSPDMRASLIHGGGKMIYSSQQEFDLPNIDLSKKPDSFFNRHRKSRQELSLQSGRNALNENDRLVAFRTVDPEPLSMSNSLVIAISRSTSAIYQQWYRQAKIKAGLFGLLVAMSTLGLFFYERRQRAYANVIAVRNTERVQAKTIALNEHFVRTITDALPDLVAYFDRDLRCAFANKGYLDWYGISAEDVKGLLLRELLGPTLFATNEPHIDAALSGQSPQVEQFFTKRDGSIGHVLANYIPDLDVHGEIIGFVLVISDIKAFKHAEAQLKLAANIFANTAEGIMETDKDGVLLSVNPAFTAITGYTAQEAIGQTPRMLKSDRHSQGFHQSVWHEITTTGKWEGEIWNRRKDGGLFLQWQTITSLPVSLGDEGRYVSVFRDITDMWTKNESLKHLAFHDALTALPNRLLLTERIDHHIAMADRATCSLVVMFLDLDRFKLVNDTYGHAVGDAMLLSVAEKLPLLLRQSDTVARVGGDEFVILLVNPASIADVKRIAHDIIIAINKPMTSQGATVSVGTSIGISIYPMDGVIASDLIGNADIAMYEAKKAGRNTYRFYWHGDAADSHGQQHHMSH
jgi:diguanylate cyclase (GGDEF)-like protein/PAS domain S-box-containing protein